jgi:exodeoxyribonuclease VII small subunit
VQSQETEPSFEAALEKLEGLVARMESGDIPLAELVERYEEGCKLLAVCAEQLRRAERKIEILRQERGSVSFEDFAPEKS